MLEDNVRAPVESCAQRIWEAMEASHRQASEEGVECHFRFIGWLGSRTNLEYLLQTQMPKRCFPRPEDHSCNPESCRVSPFPLLEHVDLDLPPPEEPVDTKLEEQTETANQEEDKCSGSRHSRPGGNFVYVIVQEVALHSLPGILTNVTPTCVLGVVGEVTPTGYLKKPTSACWRHYAMMLELCCGKENALASTP